MCYRRLKMLSTADFFLNASDLGETGFKKRNLNIKHCGKRLPGFAEVI